MTLPRFTLEEHKAVAAELFAIRNQLLKLVLKISHAFGTSSKLTRYADTAYQKIDRLRCDLESEMARDFPKEWDVHIYYPGERKEEGKPGVD